MGGREQIYVREAFATNWLSTVGPNLTAFEREFGALVGLPSVALASGTAALHLALRLVGVGPGDEVFCSTLTFAAAANAIVYQGGMPVFVDSDRATWNLDPDVLSCALRYRVALNRLPKALVVVHLYGQSADMDPILHACAQYGIAVIEDAAEAVGTLYRGKPAGTLGDIGAYSFNDPGLAYEHSELGYNYRMSNVLAGVGRGQLEALDLRVQQRRAIAFRYRDAFADLPGISLMPQASFGVHTNWLSCFLIKEEHFGCSRDVLIRVLDQANVESRPVWKPMHLQRLYAGCECYGGEIAADLFRRGICLPSSSSLSREDQLYVINQVRAAGNAKPLLEFEMEPEAIA
jgi:pyridoxal phosphate-dependent aminotransferase EpsN